MSKTRPTNPNFTGEPSRNKLIHGTEICPRRCSDCPDGRHHWIEDSVDLEWDDEEHYPVEVAILRYDREHGTGHAMAYLGCKHCPAWAEYDLLEELEQEEDDAAEIIMEVEYEWTHYAAEEIADKWEEIEAKAGQQGQMDQDPDSDRFERIALIDEIINKHRPQGEN